MNVFDVLREKLEESKSDWNNDYNVPINDAIEIINQVEQEYNNGWIPCSERLPNKEEFLKDDGRFIVTDGNRRYESIYDIYCRCFKTLKLFGLNLNGRDARFEVDKCVIAWQTLPEIYREDGIPKKQTNAERIRSMTDEELAKIIMCPYDTAGEPMDIMPCVKELGVHEMASPEYCNKCMMNWLKREVNT